MIKEILSYLVITRRNSGGHHGIFRGPQKSADGGSEKRFSPGQMHDCGFPFVSGQEFANCSRENVSSLCSLG